jgi:hypothetical protein
MAAQVSSTRPDCRIVAFGRSSLDWTVLGATVVDRVTGLQGIREAVGQVLMAVEDHHEERADPCALRR